MAKQPRFDARKDFGEPTRIKLLEQDVDTLEGAIRDLVNTGHRNQQVLVGILVAVATSSILLAINILLQAVGK